MERERERDPFLHVSPEMLATSGAQEVGGRSGARNSIEVSHVDGRNPAM